MAAKTIGQLVSDDLSRIAKQDTDINIRDDLSRLQKRVHNHLNQLIKINKMRMAPDLETFVANQQADNKDLSQQAAIYNYIRQRANKKYTAQNVEEKILILFRDSVRMIDNIRQFFTGEKIKYIIGITGESKKGQALVQHTLTLQEVLGGTKVSLYFKKNSKTGEQELVSRLDLQTKSYIRNITAQKENARKVLAEVLDTGNHSTIWSAIYEYIKAENTTGKKYNWGYAFQAYKLIINTKRHNRISKLTRDITSDQIADAYNEAYNRVKHNNAMASLGGDWLDQQLKFMGEKSSVSVMSLAQMTKTLQEFDTSLRQFLSGGTKEEFEGTLKTLFLKSSEQLMDAQFEGTALRALEEQLHNRVMQLNISI